MADVFVDQISAAFAPAAEPASAIPPCVACLNCDAALSGIFCAECGQRHETGRLSFRSLGRELMSQVVELDHGIILTFVDLLRKPGSMIREHNAGRRKSYTPPITFALLAGAALVLLMEHSPMNQAHFDAVYKETPNWVRPLYTPSQLAAYHDQRVFMVTNRAAGLLGAVVPIMLMLRYLFRKRQVNLAEMGVVACYTAGEWVFLSVLIALPFALAGKVTPGGGLPVILFIPYLIWVGFGYFGRSFSTAWRVFIALVLTVFVIAAASLVEPWIIAR